MSVMIDKLFEFDPMVFADQNPMAKQASRWGNKWCHMWAESEADLDELHRIAAKIGLKRSYFQPKQGFPHYDLVPSKRRLAIQSGAIEMDLRDWLKARMVKAGTNVNNLPSDGDRH